MRYTPYRDMPQLIKTWQAFAGNSVTAKHDTGKRCPDCTAMAYYRVLSYATTIYAQCTNCLWWYFDNQSYSVTTSKLQAIIRRIGGFDPPRGRLKRITFTKGDL